MFRAINHFIEKLALEDIEAAAKLFHNKLQSTIFTPREVDEYNRYDIRPHDQENLTFCRPPSV